MTGVIVPAALLALILMGVGITLLLSAKKAPVAKFTRVLQTLIGLVMIGGSVYWLWILWQFATGL
ncbi:hypothetical protein [Lacticaseibacillus absianus]|uniref:hypothetical protein n=1 Tax=Lacticaseibacillus absianus TaxID=2729623 RepID=UPI0015C78F32|nr:hypothetical protein [Lacticaseibacillus absianus]